MKFNEIAKAIIAAATAFAGTWGVTVADGHVSSSEVVGIFVATIVAFFGVWATTNEITVEQVLKQFSNDQLKQVAAAATK